jgi:hypothetical protein
MSEAHIAGAPTVDPLLEGATEISQELYGTPKKARRVRALVKRGVIPAGYFGGVLAIRRSRLRGCVEAIETLAATNEARS